MDVRDTVCRAVRQDRSLRNSATQRVVRGSGRKTFRVEGDWPCRVDNENDSGRKLFHGRGTRLSSKIEGTRACEGP